MIRKFGKIDKIYNRGLSGKRNAFISVCNLTDNHPGRKHVKKLTVKSFNTAEPGIHGFASDRKSQKKSPETSGDCLSGKRRENYFCMPLSVLGPEVSVLNVLVSTVAGAGVMEPESRLVESGFELLPSALLLQAVITAAVITMAISFFIQLFFKVLDTCMPS